MEEKKAKSEKVGVGAWIALIVLILILSGVIGGLIAFGMIGLFIGPVLLAVTWRLFSAWVHEIPPPGTDPDVILSELEELEEKNTH